jgi:putative transposase
VNRDFFIGTTSVQGRVYHAGILFLNGAGFRVRVNKPHEDIPMKKRFSDEQIISILREAEAGVSARELCRKHAISDATFYTWRKKYGGMEVPEVKRLKSLEEENARLKKLLAEAMLDKEALQVALGRKY